MRANIASDPVVWDVCLQLMEREMIPALGCTEPIAVALCASKAASLLNTDASIEQIDISVSRNILKNAMSVIIPGTHLYGVEYAAALGAVGGDCTKKLEVLSCYTPSQLNQAVALVENGHTHISLNSTEEPIYIKVTLIAGEHSSCAIICGAHDRFVYLERDGCSLLQKFPLDSTINNIEHEMPVPISLHDVFDFAMNVPLDRLQIIKEAVRLNSAISDDGLRHDYGLHTGRSLQSRLNCDSAHIALTDRALVRTLAAIDARMSGSTLPVMSNSGSGNQGITATLPVWSVACELGVCKEKMLRAVTFSHMIAIYIKMHLDRLSSLCGAIVAAMGSCCAISWLLGGGFDVIEGTIINMIANVTGMICDGAKASCALKVSTALQAGFSSMYLALDGIRVTGIEGIVSDSAEESIDNLGRLTRQGMKQTDQTILNIMIEK